MVDKKRIYINRTYLYRTLRKTPIKREKKGPFLIKKKSDYEWNKTGVYIKKSYNHRLSIITVRVITLSGNGFLKRKNLT